jgi:hypothetical protein
MNAEELSSFILNTIEKNSPETATIIIVEELYEIENKKAKDNPTPKPLNLNK